MKAVADNMIMDEHEEYLAYISKYKHEWQEYKGIDPHKSPRVDITASFRVRELDGTK
jgi:hypothetical protein